MDNLMQLPDKTFHRVSLKALIFDEKNRLLLFKNDLDLWELPGGGWDVGESFDTCLERELGEEINGKISEIGNIEFCYQGKTDKGYPKVSIAINVGLSDFSKSPEEADLLELKFFSREEIINLRLDDGEKAIVNFTDQIWRS
jgi:8-oxo-dGTP pyrophosphatase MutT (NUDIX family)